MLSAIFISVFFIYGVNSQVVFTVLPPFVEPGITQFFTLSCTLADQEAGQIQSISIYRRGVSARQAKIHPKETIAEIKGPAPGQTTVSPNFANVTARGQIFAAEAELAAEGTIFPRPQIPQTPEQALLALQQEAFAAQQAELAAQQAELGSYLDITWPNPTVEDLGVYTCEATVLGFGTGQTLFAEARVTTSNPLTDRLLISVSELQAQTDSFNKTLAGFQSEIDNINAALEGVSVTESELDPVTTAAGETTASTTNTTVTEEGLNYQPTTNTSSADLKKLIHVLVKLDAKFEKFNKTLQRLNNIVAKLEERVDQTAVKTPADTTVTSDVIRHYFTIGNSSFILFETNKNASSERAQAECESKRLQLAEINNAEDFLSISSEIAPIVNTEIIVLISGQRKLGQADWTFHGSQQLVNFVAWAPAAKQEQQATADECLALSRVQNEWFTVSVPCSSVQDKAFFLCQRGTNVRD